VRTLLSSQLCRERDTFRCAQTNLWRHALPTRATPTKYRAVTETRAVEQTKAHGVLAQQCVNASPQRGATHIQLRAPDAVPSS